MRRLNKAVSICLIAILILLMSVNTQAAIKINKKTASIIKGSTISLKVTGSKSKPVWESGKPKVASVNSNGVVKGLAVGTATIKAKIGKKTYSCKVTVEDPKINKSALTIEIKKSAKLRITGTKQKVKWSSSNKKVATVTNKGLVKGINGGKVIITATVGGKELACSVTVPTPRISNTSANLEVGKTVQLKITGSTQRVTWKSSNKKIATVTNKGLVKGIKQGTATITASVAGKKYKCKVTIKNKVTFTSLRGRAFGFNNGLFEYELLFYKKSQNAYLGIWRGSGTGGSLEDFQFNIQSDKKMILKGYRSRYDYLLEITPLSTEKVQVKLKCLNSSYSYFDIDKVFKLTRTFDY